ncbi:MAG: hypothetical protein AB7K09_26275 [Planctomycetota bacterium]
MPTTSDRRRSGRAPLPLLLLLALAAVATTLATGCVEREFWIVTDPPGVRVSIDGVEMKGIDGATTTQPMVDDPTEPDNMRATAGRHLGLMRIPFDRYATREIVLTRDGYETQTHCIAPAQELWEHFPFDVFTEVFLPTTIKLRFVFRFTMEGGETATPGRTLEEAERVRNAAGGKLKDAEERYGIAGSQTPPR